MSGVHTSLAEHCWTTPGGPVTQREVKHYLVHTFVSLKTQFQLQNTLPLKPVFPIPPTSATSTMLAVVVDVFGWGRWVQQSHNSTASAPEHGHSQFG